MVGPRSRPAATAHATQYRASAASGRRYPSIWPRMGDHPAVNCLAVAPWTNRDLDAHSIGRRCTAPTALEDDVPMEGDAGPTDRSAEALLEVLGDEDCRAILRATIEKPRSVTELVESCQIPSATAYRKVDRLETLGLLTQRIRIDPGGRNSTMYVVDQRPVSVNISAKNDSLEISTNAREIPSTQVSDADEKPS